MQNNIFLRTILNSIMIEGINCVKSHINLVNADLLHHLDLR